MYTCNYSFISQRGKHYVIGSEIDSYEYNSLSLLEQNKFSRKHSESYASPDTNMYTAPSYDPGPSFDFGSSSPDNNSSPDFGGFGGGDGGGGGATGSWDSGSCDSGSSD